MTPEDLDFSEYTFVTEVGSRAWSMADLSSDHDMFCCYVTPASYYMKHSNFKSTRASKTHVIIDGVEYDFQYMDIGHVVGLLLKGNINAIWAVCSPIAHKQSDVLRELREITQENLSTFSYYSIKGMAISQERDSIKRADARPPAKSLLTAMRTVHFGIALLSGEGLKFNAFTNNMTTLDEMRAYLDYSMNVLEVSHQISALPEKPDPKPFEDFLYRVRMEQAEEEMDCI